MDGLGFVRRGVILTVTTGLAVAGHAGEPPLRPVAAPQLYGWQYPGLSGGPYVTPGVGRGAFIGPAWGPGWYGVRGAAGSVWTNNLSLYGPPIPTYAPVPGAFGQADQSRLFFHQPPPGFLYGVGVGLGWGGRYTPSPRPRAPSVSVYPRSTASSVQVISGDPATTTPVIRVCVKIADAGADRWIEKTAMAQKGTERTFESPALEVGKTYRYELLARWSADGRDHAETRVISAKPGDTVHVDFSVAE